METTYTPTQSCSKEETIKLIKEFIEEENKVAFGGTLEQQVYHFFGGVSFPDNTYAYGLLSVALLRTLAKPEIGTAIKQEMGADNYDDMLEMIGRLISFCEGMNTAVFEAVADLYNMENISNPESSIVYKYNQYSVKLAALTAARGVKEQIANSKNAQPCM